MVDIRNEETRSFGMKTTREIQSSRQPSMTSHNLWFGQELRLQHHWVVQ